MTPVGASSTFQVTAVEAVDRLSKMLLDAYVETDEEVGPRVAQFEEAEGQLRLIGEQVTSMRDAISAKHEAHMAMIALSAPMAAELGLTFSVHGARGTCPKKRRPPPPQRQGG